MIARTVKYARNATSAHEVKALPESSRVSGGLTAGHERAAPEPTSTQDVPDRLCTLQISTWTYAFDHASVRHLGPMAQDSTAAFGLGSNDRHISVVDANGSVPGKHPKTVALRRHLLISILK